MRIRKPKVREQYVALHRAAQVLRLSDSQLEQYLVTGQLFAAFMYHRPSDYRETREVALAGGGTEKHTKTHRTLFRATAKDYQPIQLMYLRPEDTATILLNKVPARAILVQQVFEDRALNPKKGALLLGDSALEVRRDDLVVPSDELAQFAKHARIRIDRAAKHELGIPWRSWYDRPIGRTVLAVLGGVTASVITMWIRGEL